MSVGNLGLNQLLQMSIATFGVGTGALVAGIFGMNVSLLAFSDSNSVVSSLGS
jgi:Mg2+ and Co2+ transporter CorA